MADESVPESSQETVDPFSLFSSEIQHAVEGLTYIGQLTENAEFCGHSFGLKTLQPQHKFAISLALQPYRNTIHEVDAYQALTVGMALTHVDYDENFCPAIGPDLVEFARARMQYVASKWYPPLLEYLWNRQALLEATALKAIEELDRLAQRSQPPTSPPWLDSLTAPGASDEPTSSDTPLFTTSN